MPKTSFTPNLCNETTSVAIMLYTNNPKPHYHIVFFKWFKKMR